MGASLGSQAEKVLALCGLGCKELAALSVRGRGKEAKAQIMCCRALSLLCWEIFLSSKLGSQSLMGDALAASMGLPNAAAPGELHNSLRGST